MDYPTDTIAQQIAVVERAPSSYKSGAAGERGPYQLTFSVWSQHTTLPFELADHEVYAKPIAKLHLEWLKTNLIKAGFVPSTYRIALAWNAGLTTVIRHREKPRSIDFANRVRNLVEASSNR